MNPIRLILLISLLTISTIHAQRNKSQKPYAKEIPEEIFQQKGFASIRPDYKATYFDIVPYLYYNEKGRFREVKGEFYHVTYHQVSDLYLDVSFIRRIGRYKNVLTAVIALTPTSTLPLNDLEIKVTSFKHGELIPGKPWGIAHLNKRQQRRLFYKELNLEDISDILKLVKDDIITITVDGESYRFVNPELEFEE